MWRYDREVHLCYIDEAGSSGKNLADKQQPVFAMAGILVSDERWKKIEHESRAIVEKALGRAPPPGFEIHAGDLLAPNGKGPFAAWPHAQRQQLALELLRLIATRNHQVLLQIIHKPRMAAATPPTLPLVDWRDPWEVGFASVLTQTEEFLRSGRTGRQARAWSSSITTRSTSQSSVVTRASANSRWGGDRRGRSSRSGIAPSATRIR